MLTRKFKHWFSITLILGLLGLSLGVSAATAIDDGGRKVKTKVSPVYPDLAKRMNLSGVVKVEVVIAANGSVKDTKVIGGHPLLVESAVSAVKKWRYEPASNDTTQVVEFQFSNGNDR
ncbi:MAG TPA: energy transducer TonB [Terriglobales bacterium]|nr:energy transducer TonB [Terriglobales bacterium]